MQLSTLAASALLSFSFHKKVLLRGRVKAGLSQISGHADAVIGIG